ncbi:MAG: oxidoreductase [Planctomycetaceae bacterium]|nr:MAG: oxidoreductase [Planctomycetaceae bacterium]
MSHMGFGIVGCGMISHFHAEAIRHIPEARLVGCYSASYSSAEKLAQQYPGVKAYRTLDELLADPSIHVVNICTPSGAHMEPALQAARAGKHVVVEKPLEITLARCDAIIQTCREQGVQLCPIFPSRFSPANMVLKQAIGQGRFGRLTLGDTYVKWWRTQEYYDQGGWRGTWALDGGGSYMNQAIHNVDLLYWFMGDVAEVCGMTATLAHERIEVEDVGVATLRFRNGALGVIEATTSAWPGLLKRTEIHGTHGSAIVEQDDLLLWKFSEERPEDRDILEQFTRKVGGTGGASDPKAISFRGHMEQLKDFVQAIQTGTTPKITGEEGRKAVEIILAIYQSAWTGQRVSLPLSADPVRPNV